MDDTEDADDSVDEDHSASDSEGITVMMVDGGGRRQSHSNRVWL